MRFRGAPLGRELRAAMAEKRGVRAEQLQLEQWRARRKEDGRTVASVAEGDFADDSGRRTPWMETEGGHGHVIADEDVVLTAGPLRAWIGVFRKRL